MNDITLKNKPLVEAIFELRWELQEPIPGIKIDPQYKLLIGRVFERVKEEFPFHEVAPTTMMPDEMAGYIVQHRFRKERNKWPLIQVGPGIITLNDTEEYTWENFEIGIHKVLDALYEIYPDTENRLSVNRLLLRYIDAVAFDYIKVDIFDFLREKMKTNIKLEEKLFEDTGVNNSPLHFDMRFSFPVDKPDGILHLRFVRGKRAELESLIWETMVESTEKNVPNEKTKISNWIKEAHDLTHNWFFKIIEGELLKRFE